MAIRTVLPGYDALGTPLAELIAPLETALYGRQAMLVAAASEQGATAASIMTSLLRQVQSMRANAPGAGSSTSANTAGAASAAGDAIEDALTGAPFIAFKTAIGAASFLTADGRRAAFEAATVGDCSLPIRILVAAEVGLAKRHPALGTLLSLRAFLPEWFTYCIAVDASGATPQALRGWGVTGEGGAATAFLDQFLKYDYDTMDWMGSHATPGLLH